MRKETVSEYASRKDISRQAVYGLIKRGKIDIEEIDGVKMVVTTGNAAANVSKSNCKEMVKPYKQLVKHQDKQIKYLEDQVTAAQKSRDDMAVLLQKLYSGLNSNLLTNDHIEAKVIKKKKRKKKRK